MLAAARTGKRAVVIGGGLLGLEAANGLSLQGMDVSVVHLCDWPMERQLDQASGGLLQRALEKRRVSEIACLGDIVGFDVLHYRYLSTRNASYCLDLVRQNCRWVVAGNHDLFAIRKLPDVNGCFPFPENWYRLDFQERKELGRQRVWLFEPQELPASAW